MSIRSLLILLAAILMLAGCGRRGDLEAPGVTTPAELATAATPVTAVSPLDPGSGGVEREPPPAEAPRKRFPLDVLL